MHSGVAWRVQPQQTLCQPCREKTCFRGNTQARGQGRGHGSNHRACLAGSREEDSRLRKAPSSPPPSTGPSEFSQHNARDLEWLGQYLEYISRF